MPKAKERDGVFQRKDRAGFYISYQDCDGKRRKERVAAHTLTQAREILNARKLEAEQIRSGLKPRPAPAQKTTPCTTDELIKQYLEYQRSPVRTRKKRRAVAESTSERTEAILKALRKQLPGLVNEINESGLRSIFDTRVVDVKPATLAKEITIIRHMLKLAATPPPEGFGMLKESPAQHIYPPEIQDVKTRYLTVDEISKVLAGASDPLRAVLQFALATGLRRSEFLRLQWSDIDFEGRAAWLSDSKNGDAIHIPLNDEAIDALKSLKPGSPESPVFPDWTGPQITMKVKRLFKRLRIESASLHTTRHSFASHTTMAGESMYTVQQLMRHKTARMTERYSHLSPDHLRAAASKMSAVLKAAKPGPRLVPVASPALPSATGTDGNSA